MIFIEIFMQLLVDLKGIYSMHIITWFINYYYPVQMIRHYRKFIRLREWKRF